MWPCIKPSNIAFLYSYNGYFFYVNRGSIFSYNLQQDKLCLCKNEINFNDAYQPKKLFQKNSLLNKQVVYFQGFPHAYAQSSIFRAVWNNFDKIYHADQILFSIFTQSGKLFALTQDYTVKCVQSNQVLHYYGQHRFYQFGDTTIYVECIERPEYKDFSSEVGTMQNFTQKALNHDYISSDQHIFLGGLMVLSRSRPSIIVMDLMHSKVLYTSVGESKSYKQSKHTPFDNGAMEKMIVATELGLSFCKEFQDDLFPGFTQERDYYIRQFLSIQRKMQQNHTGRSVVLNAIHEIYSESQQKRVSIMDKVKQTDVILKGLEQFVNQVIAALQQILQ